MLTSGRGVADGQRRVDASGRHDGYAVEASSVDLALLESTANGITLNAGQATLVREMATSGARLQLAIAPAGSGKTTAMRALASAWSDGGGTIIGRSEEHTSELQSLMRISYAVFCLQKKTTANIIHST